MWKLVALILVFTLLPTLGPSEGQRMLNVRDPNLSNQAGCGSTDDPIQINILIEGGRP